ncbi:MAG: 1-pyrroline-5-carboxylate dehydrogenase, partial [Proteiniphilum acetatigenes]
MSKGIYQLPEVRNEPVKSYAPGSPERKALKQKLEELNRGGLDLP